MCYWVFWLAMWSFWFIAGIPFPYPAEKVMRRLLIYYHAAEPTCMIFHGAAWHTHPPPPPSSQRWRNLSHLKCHFSKVWYHNGRWCILILPTWQKLNRSASWYEVTWVLHTSGILCFCGLFLIKHDKHLSKCVKGSDISICWWIQYVYSVGSFLQRPCCMTSGRFISKVCATHDRLYIHDIGGTVFKRQKLD